MLRNELERQRKALGQEVALLHKEKNALHDKGEHTDVTASAAGVHNLNRRDLKLCLAKISWKKSEELLCTAVSSGTMQVYFNIARDVFEPVIRIPF